MKTFRALTESSGELIQHIQQTIGEYAERGITPYHINNGHCEDFAHDVLEKHLGRDWVHHEGTNGNPGITATEDHMDDGPGHVWIHHQGKHYDAETPKGVSDPHELPIFKNQANRGR